MSYHKVTEVPLNFSPDRQLAEVQWRRGKQRAEERASEPQPPLPFGDGWMDDAAPEWHGTAVGFRRHIAAGEEFCQLCEAFLGELVAAGRAAPVGEKPEWLATLHSQTGADQQERR